MASSCIIVFLNIQDVAEKIPDPVQQVDIGYSLRTFSLRNLS